jgi:hypothetical protein
MAQARPVGPAPMTATSSTVSSMTRCVHFRTRRLSEEPATGWIARGTHRAKASGLMWLYLAGALLALPPELPGERFSRPLGLPLLAAGTSEVQKKLGTAPITETGHFEDTSCYFVTASKTMVIFSVGREGISAAFTMRRTTGSVPAECVPMSRAARRLALEVEGLRLGMTLVSFEKTVGKTADLNVFDVPGGMRGVEFAHTRTVSQTDIFVHIVVAGRFENGRLVELIVRKTAST